MGYSKNRYDIIAEEIAGDEISPSDRLRRDKTIVLGLRTKNRELKSQIKELLANNQKLVEVIEVLDEKIGKLTQDMEKTHQYSFTEGGWIENGSISKRNLELRKKDSVSVSDINTQLKEILRLIDKYKKT
jgi:hypothetical protein